jgi:fibronectin type 3 domain-containing protein
MPATTILCMKEENELQFLWNGKQHALKQTVVYAMLLSLLFSLLPPAAYAGEPQTGQSPNPLSLPVNDTFEDGTLPSGYTVTLPTSVVPGQAVEVTDVTGTGNNSRKALMVNDTGAGNVQFTRSFDKQTGDVIIESDFMFPQESGTSSLFEVKNAEGNKTAFIIGVRVPTQPEQRTSGQTLIYDLKNSQYYGLMNPFLPLNQWHNIRMEIKTAQNKVAIYIDSQFVNEFNFTTADVGNIGQVLSKTPGGGKGQFLIDNFRVYTPSAGGENGGGSGPENPDMAAPGSLNGYVNEVNGAPAVWLNWESVTGAVYYNVKRSDTRDGAYTTLQSVAQSVYSVMDSSVTAGKTYFYTVTASTHNVAAGAAGGTESAPSNIFEITAELPDSGIAVDIPAFPGAEGGGKYVTGGRGGEVYIVDTLADYTKNEKAIPGSLRDAVSKDNRTIIFRVGGTIHLKESLNIIGSNLTIAGQTAPGDGITVADYTTNINANNIAIRYVHFRLTDRYPSEDDSLGSRYYKNIIIDHCSFSWAVDEVVSLYDNVNTTVQWSISSEAMLMTTHQKGRHGYGGIWGGKNSTYHHNLIANSTSRNPRFPTDKREFDSVDMANNIIYNWGLASTYGGGEGNYNVRDNYYKYGPSTYYGVRSQLFSEAGTTNYDTNMYVGGNYMDSSPSVTEDNWKGVLKIIDPTVKHDTPFEVRGEYDNGVAPENYGTYQSVPALTAYEQVLADVGATLPRRDAIDARIVNEVKNRTGYHINSPKEVGWLYEDYTTVHSDIVDTDKDGIPDSWELEHGLNPQDASDRNKTNLAKSGSFASIGIVPGYTNLEVYLAWLIEDLKQGSRHVDNPYVTLQLTDSQNNPLGNNSIAETGGSLNLSATTLSGWGKNISKVEFIIDSQLVGTATSYPYTFTWSNIPEGTHYLVAKATDSTGLATHTGNITVHVNTTTAKGDWSSADIGGSASGYIPGHLSVKNDGSLTLKSAGDIGGKTDQFHFAYQALTGNSEITTRIDHITATDDNAEAGVMIRESLDPGSRMALMAVAYVKFGKQGVMLVRSENGGSTQRIENEVFVSTPHWVKLVRFGNQVTGLISEDGANNWRKVGSVTLNLPDDKPIYVGLAADASKPDDDVWKYNASTFGQAAIHALPDDYPVAPGGLKTSIEEGDNEIKISWDAAENAHTYTLKRGDTPGGPYKVIQTGITDTFFTDSGLVAGKTYYYVVSATNQAGEQGFDSSEISGNPTGPAENIFYVDDSFEEEAIDSTPAAYVPSLPKNGGFEAVKVVTVEKDGNPDNKALLVADQGANSDEMLQSVSFFRQFESLKNTVVIEADYMLPETSGNAVLLQIKSRDDSKRAFSIGMRKPTLPSDANKNDITLVYDNGSSSFYALMDVPYTSFKNQWFTIKLKMNVAEGYVTISVNGKEIATFTDYKDIENFKNLGIGRLYSATPGGGSGTYYIDNVKVYVEPIAHPTGLNATAGDGVVNLSWSTSEDAETYTVLRSTKEEGPFIPVEATEAQANPVPATVTQFSDKTAVNGTTYYYVVTAENPQGKSAYSNVVSAAPVATNNGGGGGNGNDEDGDNSGNTGVNPAPSTSVPGQAADGIVLGKEAAQVREEQTPDGTKLQVAVVDAAKLADALKKAAADKAGKVTLDLSSAVDNAAAVRTELPVSALAEAGSVDLLVKTALAEVKLPSQLILSQLKDQTAGTLQATIAAGSAQLQEKAAQAATQAGYQLSVQPVSISLAVEAAGRKQGLALSSGYASLTLTYSGLLNSATATGVRIDPVTGEASFAPAIIETDGGRTRVTVLHKGDGIYAVAQGSKTFTDTAGHWAKQDIELLASKLLIQGTAAHSYSPDQAITRAEFAALLVRSLGLGGSGQTASFTDVASGDWYTDAVAAAAGAGLIEGFDNGEFRPGANISREEMAVMAARAARYAGVDTTASAQAPGYTDSSIVSGWAQTSMAWATEKGIIQGTDAQHLAPQDTATRAQSATILKRVLQAMSFIN